ncbi:hypothetical protein KM1_175640 [Entamoeba histolytica HM-3:IMSS]|uniref:CXXC-rich protein n=4 Tax=Entamoeba histolytica TaxID=5759 RepID=C4M2N1_ENTH1|nr:hypothetical protein EHI_005960 [Entamoeba histolytica HM-1:IMSS]EAL48032.1 hypothetical protein EHI_005960 [Entamoeba histolytica HM-1:IMSS]EMS13229.1 hypothetical protein KM1_175640 [Entamoeba histolytica HM-3:IMSS]ENY64450.1 hypothetical protein EHI7A_100270 [Entamoeba histolytica HM-1:IMSS-A]GAT95539.1 hypothetical protein CL6EHI_005960 [Entamoeba histolytica]|eukprot:XP_653420.1 hypothetical protein EHI_005960 [Entamoeba histolytica HM-1:IMSS]
MKLEVIILLIAITFAQCGVSNCMRCVNGTDSKCEECNNGYFISQTGLCVEKSRFIGCKTFGSIGCDQCIEGYVKVSNFVCMECHSFFTNCNECTSTECKTCDNGYDLKDANTEVPGITKVCASSMSFIVAVLMVIFILL